MAVGYFVKPTQPANSSCPGQPCLTLAEYINNTEYYFRSNNNSVFRFLSGRHHISSPVVVTDAYNVTLKNYGEKDYQIPLVVFSPIYYCACTTPISVYSVCGKCSIFQFTNVSMVRLSHISLEGSAYNDTSSVNGISFEMSENISVTNVKIALVNNTFVAGPLRTLTGIFLYHTFFSFIKNITTYRGAVVLQYTVNTYLENMTLSYCLVFTNYYVNTTVCDASIRNSDPYGIDARNGHGLVVEHVNISETVGHCIRVGLSHNTFISGTHAMQCTGNGIELQSTTNTLLRDSFFGNLYTIIPVTAAIGLFNASNTIIENVEIDINFVIFSIANIVSKSTHISNVYILGSQSLVVIDSKNTILWSVKMANSTSGVHFFNSVQIQVLHSTIMIRYMSPSNESTNGLSMSSSSDAVIHNITVNSLVVVNGATNVNISSVTITAIASTFAMSIYKSGNVTIESCCFVELGAPLSGITNHPAVVFLYRSMDINLNNCVFARNSVSALEAIASNLTLSGTVLFANNTASMGAALLLQQKSVITLALNSSVLFVGNHATLVGGAIYADTNTFYTATDTGDIYMGSVCMIELVRKDQTILEFHNNSAGSGGDVVYGGHMELATTADGSNCLLQFKNISVVSQNNTMSVISSQPSRVCVCNSTGHPDCLKIFYSHTVYPGESISLKADVVGQDFGTGSSAVYSQFLSSDVEKKARLEQWQYSQRVSQTHCNELTYSILAAPVESMVLVLTALEMPEVQAVSNSTVQSALEKYRIFKNGNGQFPQQLLDFPIYINITIKPCPHGFSLSESPFKCVCSPQLRKLPGIMCYIENQTFERREASWIGLNEDKNVVVSQYCLFLFCKDIPQNITLADLDLQCNYNHSGFLCGGCQSGFSIAIGSNRCLHCSNRYLSLLIPIALAGLALVFAIKVLDITVSTGYINGLALYFNTIRPAWAVVVPKGHNSILSTIVAWTNLDIGIESCFFDGLTMYWKTWLQFLFPLYIWTISGVVIILAKHSYRLAKMMGSNPVPVLATLFLLSYTKLLRVCIAIISYSYVEYPGSIKMVWASDGNIEYLGAHHLPLFLVAVGVLTFLCVPYTLILLLGQWLKKCESQLISRVMFRVKPIMDAYYGPLEDKHHYWVGVLLLSRAFIHVVLSLTPSSSYRVTLLPATSLLAIVLLQMTVYVKGFYRNRYVTSYEVTLISNLALYSLAKLYFGRMESETNVVIDSLFTAAAISQLMLLILYRLYFIIKPLRFGCYTMCWRGVKQLRQVECKSEENLGILEEAPLLGPNSETVDDGNDQNNTVPMRVDSIPTYGT